MIEIKNISSVYFIGIGGIGMSALARYFLSKGVQVAGYDKTETAHTKQLIAEGAKVVYTDDIDSLQKSAQLVVYTPAIPTSHVQWNYYKDNGYPLAKRSDVLQMITADTFNICIAGTHGKTTITTMVAHILRHSGYGCNAFLGGISANYQSNFWASERELVVLEADEFDRSFLKLSPDLAVISSMDPDHLDIYHTKEEFAKAFVQFADQLKSGGMLYHKYGLIGLPTANAVTFDLRNTSADIYTKSLEADRHGFRFSVCCNGEMVDDLYLPMGGTHNVENMLPAIGIALKLGISIDNIRDAIGAFKGIKRRFEIVAENENVVYIDDYAHHPQELKALLGGVKANYPDFAITVVFQPHLYTRTRDFAQAFGEALAMAGHVMLLPLYPAREQPIEGVSSELISQFLPTNQVTLVSKDEAIQFLTDLVTNAQQKLVLITAGAGDIDTLVERIKILIKE